MKWIGRHFLLELFAVLVAGGTLAVHLLRSMSQVEWQLKLAGLNLTFRFWQAHACL